jgi:KDO2-lipid IV(A) lauroyltransferase
MQLLTIKERNWIQLTALLQQEHPPVSYNSIKRYHMNTRSTFRHRLEYCAVYMVYLIVNIVPYRIIHLIAAVISFTGFSLLKVRREETIQRIRESLNIPEDEAVRVAKKAYFNITASSLEFLRFKRMRKIFDKGYITIENLDILRDIGKKKSGGVLVGMHSGNWEISGAALSFLEYPLFYVVGIQHNPFVDNLINNMRKAVGIELIPKKGALKDVFRRLKHGELLGIIADQHVSGDSIEIEFFGRTVSAPRGPAGFARKTGTPLIPYTAIRKGACKHSVRVHEPILPDDSIDTEADILRMTREYNRVFEGVIRENPENWFWLHRRWRGEEGTAKQ